MRWLRQNERQQILYFKWSRLGNNWVARRPNLVFNDLVSDGLGKVYMIAQEALRKEERSAKVKNVFVFHDDKRNIYQSLMRFLIIQYLNIQSSFSLVKP